MASGTDGGTGGRTRMPVIEPEAELPPARPARRGKLPVGLLGGSFNPAHRGHRMISLMALRRLGLQEVWWLVSPQNPLKEAAGMAPLAQRIQGANAVSRHRRIRVEDLEARLGTCRTVDTLRLLKARRRDLAPVWLMGADNLAQIPQWHSWQEIFRLVPVAVFDRPHWGPKALSGRAARRFAGCRIPERDALGLAFRDPPAWVYFHGHLDTIAASDIRAGATETQGNGPGSGPGEVSDNRPDGGSGPNGGENDGRHA